MRYVNKHEVEPGNKFEGKQVYGWHVTDNTFTRASFGCSYRPITVKFMDGSSISAILVEKVR